MPNVEKQKKNDEEPEQDEPMGGKVTTRKPYTSPVLVEYGTIAKLTQGNKTRNNDGKNARRRRRCL